MSVLQLVHTRTFGAASFHCSSDSHWGFSSWTPAVLFSPAFTEVPAHLSVSCSAFCCLVQLWILSICPSAPPCCCFVLCWGFLLSPPALTVCLTFKGPALSLHFLSLMLPGQCLPFQSGMQLCSLSLTHLEGPSHRMCHSPLCHPLFKSCLATLLMQFLTAADTTAVFSSCFLGWSLPQALSCCSVSTQGMSMSLLFVCSPQLCVFQAHHHISWALQEYK